MAKRRIPPGHLAAEAYSDLDGKDAADAADLAGRIVLMPAGSWMAPDPVWRVSRLDTATAIGLPTARKSKDVVAVVSNVPNRKEGRQVRADIESAGDDWKNWNLDETMWPMTTGRGALDPDRFALSVRRPGRRRSEGVLVGERSVEVRSDKGRAEVVYHVGLGFIYVVPEASSKHQGAALVAGACRQIREDLEGIMRCLEMAKRPASVTVVVAGDAYSPAGLGILRAVSDVAEAHVVDIFADDGACERDFQQRILGEAIA